MADIGAFVLKDDVVCTLLESCLKASEIRLKLGFNEGQETDRIPFSTLNNLATEGIVEKSSAAHWMGEMRLVNWGQVSPIFHTYSRRAHCHTENAHLEINLMV